MVDDFEILIKKCNIPLYHVSGLAIFRKCLPRMLETGSVEDRHLRSGAEPWHHTIINFLLSLHEVDTVIFISFLVLLYYLYIYYGERDIMLTRSAAGFFNH